MERYLAIYQLLMPLLLAITYFNICVINRDASQPVKPGTPLKTSLLFTVSGVLFLYLGYLAAAFVKNRIEGDGLWVSLVMTALVGGRIILKAWKVNDNSVQFNLNEPFVSGSLAVLRGINYLFIGVAVRFIDISFGSFLLFTGIATLLLAFSGMIYMSQFSRTTARTIEIIAGFLVLLLALPFAGFL